MWKDKWAAFKARFRAWWEKWAICGVIALGRAQVIAGTIWQVLITTDMSPFVTNQRYLAAWLIFVGVVTEFTRRYKATDLGA